VQETLNELLPLAAGVLVPKGYAPGDDYSALSRRLKVIGVGMPTPSAA
jgi:hypothetical protein